MEPQGGVSCSKKGTGGVYENQNQKINDGHCRSDSGIVVKRANLCKGG